jgi:hypothetical protein
MLRRPKHSKNEVVAPKEEEEEEEDDDDDDGGRGVDGGDRRMYVRIIE